MTEQLKDQVTEQPKGIQRGPTQTPEKVETPGEFIEKFGNTDDEIAGVGSEDKTAQKPVFTLTVYEGGRIHFGWPSDMPTEYLLGVLKAAMTSIASLGEKISRKLHAGLVTPGSQEFEKVKKAMKGGKGREG